jgi:hypothetical protein
MPEFCDIIQKAWSIECPHLDLVSIWQLRIRNLRKKVKGWNRNREAELKKSKARLVAELDELDLLTEQYTLSEVDQEGRKDLSHKLNQIWYMEEIKAKLRSRDR